MATTTPVEKKLKSTLTQEKPLKEPAKKPKAEKPSSNDAKERASRLKAVELAVEQIERQFGQGSIMKLGEGMKVAVETIPTGSLSLDLALGGGLPKGRIVEIYGPESSGKTTLALHAVAEVQKNGGLAAFIDAEHAMDPEYSAKIGVKLDDLLISQPDTGEQALEICETLVRSSAVDVIVIEPQKNEVKRNILSNFYESI